MSNSNFFKNKTILITGANKGLGYYIAEHFAKKDAELILCGRNIKKNYIAKKKLSKLTNKKIYFVKLDVSNIKSVDSFFKKIFKKYNKIDVLINNAGIYGPIGRVDDLDWKKWVETININLLGSIYFIKKIIPHFTKNKYGKIVQLSGGGAASPFPNFSPYSVSKVGVVRFIENIAIELKNRKIYANSIAPGTIDTGMLDKVIRASPSKVGKEFYNKSLKHKKNGGTDVNKILELVEFLSHKKSDGISGKLISVLWDNWREFHKFKKQLKNSDVGTLRRLAGRDRKLKFFDNE